LKNNRKPHYSAEGEETPLGNTIVLKRKIYNNKEDIEFHIAIFR